MDAEKKGNFWKSPHRMPNIAENGSGMTQPYFGLHKGLEPTGAVTKFGAAAQKLVDETIELERERRRIRIEGPDKPNRK